MDQHHSPVRMPPSGGGVQPQPVEAAPEVIVVAPVVEVEVVAPATPPQPTGTGFLGWKHETWANVAEGAKTVGVVAGAGTAAVLFVKAVFGKKKR